jgi:hypothetical protein
LASEPQGFALHFEALLRVHLSPYGTKDDLLRALERAKCDAEALLRTGVTVGSEFAEEHHQFQEQVHMRAILFDYLWRFGLSMYLWAEHWHDRVITWPDLNGTSQANAEGVALIRAALADSPLAVGEPME